MVDEIRNIAILGSGAMGGIYAAHFCSAGLSVSSVARGERARRLKEHGLIVNGERVSINVLDMDSTAEPIDLVIVAVKHHQLDEALDDVAPLVGEGTLFLSVLNGLDSEETIANRFNAENVLYCIALGMDAAREANRVEFKQPGKLVFGAADNRESDQRVMRVQRALDRAGLSFDTPDDMLRELWWKFMVNVGINQASALMGAGYGEFMSEGPARNLMSNLIDEVIELSQHAGIKLGSQDLDRWHTVLGNQSPAGKTSMLQDINAKRPTELDIFAGRVIRMGNQYEVPVPYNQMAFDCLSHWSIHSRSLSE